MQHSACHNTQHIRVRNVVTFESKFSFSKFNARICTPLRRPNFTRKLVVQNNLYQEAVIGVKNVLDIVLQVTPEQIQPALQVLEYNILRMILLQLQATGVLRLLVGEVSPQCSIVNPSLDSQLGRTEDSLVPVVITVLLLGLEGSGAYRFNFDKQKLENFLTDIYGCPNILGTGNQISTGHDIIYDVFHVQAETKRWQRGGKFGKRSVAIDPTNSEEDQEREAVLLAEKQRYQQLQFEFQLWTLALTAVSFSVTYSFYTKEVAASYLLGALGGFIYLRLLNRSVDEIGTFSVGSLAGQPRLLIPVILVLAFNRWNGLYADDFSLKLQLLPTLIGFFTYKGAVIARQSIQLFQDMTSQQGGQQKQVGQSQIVQDGEGGIQQAAELDLSARSVDRAFVKKILTQ
eukprot:TRINITY_DN996_c1_g1_i10.p2 TRINITY_DN996_c1_g1~~TRINITY_DN996_c1_g1_i10.p2  ORF type:complete len:402 (-),score=30.12 TRINITY_DN996_c1_g1_i10:413-1618(-)